MYNSDIHPYINTVQNNFNIHIFNQKMSPEIKVPWAHGSHDVAPERAPWLLRGVPSHA